MLALRLAWRSFIRHRWRSIITGLAISLGLALMIISLGMGADGHRRMIEMGVKLGSGHVVVQGKGFQEEQTLDHLVADPQRVMNIALISVAGISLLVGGIGIANIMLATVTERTREIGVRRALGAKRRHIVLQFLAETTTMSGIGGLLGIGAGFAMTKLLNLLAGWEGIISGDSVGLAFGISMGVGILSGMLPARRAAMLDPIAALRHE